MTEKRSYRFAVLRLVFLLCLMVSCGMLRGQQAREYQVKSVFLLNFTQFVDWPPQAFSSSSAPFVIGVLGQDPFGATLEETVKDETVAGHPIVVQRYASVRDLKPCHLLFVSSSFRDGGVLPVQQTLTVGDGADFIRNGGMIQFFMENNRVRFEVRPSLVKAAHLAISSKLLRLAKIAD